MVELAADCTGIIAGNEPLTAEVLRALPRLRCISRCGTGTDNIDLDAARALGISVRRTPDAPVTAVAELTVGLVLTLLRHLHTLNAAVHAGGWPRLAGTLLEGRTVGIVGLGRIGRAVTDRLTPFGCRIVAADPSPEAARWAENRPVEMGGLPGLLAAASILLLHTPSTDRPLLGEAEFAAMRPGALLVNVARGKLVDEAALHRALLDERLAGAALDVFHEEPYKGPLAAMPQVVLTPHIGSFTTESRTAMEIQAVAHLLEGLGHQ
ncbi:hydroxyacid dehydrogenase [Streptomyces sp. SID4928]|nr:hydroxyacid dehydrogenase [Streptomyces sp. SID4928]